MLVFVVDLEEEKVSGLDWLDGDIGLGFLVPRDERRTGSKIFCGTETNGFRDGTGVCLADVCFDVDVE